MRKLHTLSLALALFAAASAASAPAALAATSAQIPNGQQQFADANGVPYAGGSVCFYVPGTSTPSLTYQDPGLTVPNTSPCVTLNASGRAIIWGSGEYRQILYNSSAVLIWDQLVVAGVSAGATLSGVTCASCTISGSTSVSGTVTMNVAGTFIFPDGSAWTSSGLTPSGHPISLSALPTQANGTVLANVSGGVAVPSAVDAGKLSSALCQPQVTSYTSGSGTYTTPTCAVSATLPSMLSVKVLGGGGGGGGSGGAGVTSGGAGANSTFGAVVTADGGNGSSANSIAGAAGGNGSGGVCVSGGQGNPATSSATTAGLAGGAGASGPFGGAGAGGNNSGGAAGTSGSGTGGGGAGGNASYAGTGGGGAGAYCMASISSPAGTYAYSVGAGGTLGTAGSSGIAGGPGGSGLIIIEATWQ